MLDLYLVLGCGGKILEDIIICRETENVIIDLSQHKITNNIINFLDNPCGLFNKPIVELNLVTNILTILYDSYSAFDKIIWGALQYWVSQHKRCGIYLKLFLKEEYTIKNLNNQYIEILPGKSLSITK